MINAFNININQSSFMSSFPQFLINPPGPKIVEVLLRFSGSPDLNDKFPVQPKQTALSQKQRKTLCFSYSVQSAFAKQHSLHCLVFLMLHTMCVFYNSVHNYLVQPSVYTNVYAHIHISSIYMYKRKVYIL